MKRVSRQLGASLLLLALCGCVERSLSSADIAGIHAIAIKQTYNPTEYGLFVGNVGAAIAMGAAVGPGATAAMIQQSTTEPGQQSTFTELLQAQDLRLGDELDAGVEAKLREAGYTMVSWGDPRANAILSFYIDQSTYERRVWGAIGPHLVIRAILNDVSGKKIFERIYRYDMEQLNIGLAAVLTPDNKYGFDEPADVLAHPDIAAAGLRAVIPLIAENLSRALQKQR